LKNRKKAEVSEIIVSKSKNVAIIRPTEKFEDFWKNNGASYTLDIAHGGYPKMFRHFAQEYRNRQV
jgi:hypothetical protein